MVGHQTYSDRAGAKIYSLKVAISSKAVTKITTVDMQLDSHTQEVVISIKVTMNKATAGI